MAARVIQGSFVVGRPRIPSPVAQPMAMPRLPGPPVPAFAVPRRWRSRVCLAPPPPPFAGRPPGPPVPAFAARPPVVQRHGAGDAFSVDPGQLGLASSGGRPLPEAVRGKMEAALGADFSNVRVHVGPQAERIGAIAFTLGSDIYFAPGRFQPETPHGQQLLGHELAHVVQQRAGRVRNPLGLGIAVVQDRALEAEADRLGQRAAAHRVAAQPKMGDATAARGSGAPLFASRSVNRLQRPAPSSRVERPERPKRAAPMRPVVVPPSRSHSGRVALQRHRVIGPQNIYHNDDDVIAAKLGPSDYPVAVVESAGYFKAQEKMSGGRAEDEYLDTRGGRTDQAYIRKATRPNLSLRVSDDLQMAIEDSEYAVTGRHPRQPKIFFASDSVIAAANRKLTKAGGFIQLIKGTEYIHIIEASTMHRLYSVSPKFSTLPAQNCNSLAHQITTWGSPGMARWSAKNALEEITGKQWNRKEASVDTYINSLAGKYVDSPWKKEPWFINSRANPDVGEPFAILTIGEPSQVASGPDQGKSQVYDISSGKPITLEWEYHFAGVVAESGGDRVTLENYARPDKRADAPDPRWFFYMYGESTGQSFHEVQAKTGGFANPMTVVPT